MSGVYCARVTISKTNSNLRLIYFSNKYDQSSKGSRRYGSIVSRKTFFAFINFPKCLNPKTLLEKL